MQVFKFGGASVKNAEGVKNLGKIVQSAQGRLWVVVSAMGKTTNALEAVLQSWHGGDTPVALQLLSGIKQQHHLIIRNSFEGLACEPVINDVNEFFTALEQRLKEGPSDNYNYNYDLVVSLGELVSTRIVYQYIKYLKIKTTWVDAGKIIRSDNRYREAKVDWQITEAKCQSFLKDHDAEVLVTQGFIAQTAEGQRTTLGREGSDYSAAIIAYASKAEKVTIWKDVPGLLNADPRKFEDTVILPEISYKEALELSYYGASVIHPKTIKPLQNRSIPLFIRPFNDIQAEGTKIFHQDIYDNQHPSFIIKEQQVLLSLSTRDFSFIEEQQLHEIFDCFSKHGLKSNLMQNSAISFSVVVDAAALSSGLISELQEHYKVLYNEKVSLITVRHYTAEVVERLTKGKRILVEQRTRFTARFVCADASA